jgi:hypothetical protein
MMGKYVYACPDKSHPRKDVVIGIGLLDVAEILCPKCSKRMHRVPQLFRWGRNPADVLYQKIEREVVASGRFK